MSKIRKAGEGFGCTDTSPPENNSPYKLSRILDMLDVAEEIGGKEFSVVVFNLLPTSTKLEFNYSCWSYEPRIQT